MSKIFNGCFCHFLDLKSTKNAFLSFFLIILFKISIFKNIRHLLWAGDRNGVIGSVVASDMNTFQHAFPSKISSGREKVITIQEEKRRGNCNKELQ